MNVYFELVFCIYYNSEGYVSLISLGRQSRTICKRVTPAEFWPMLTYNFFLACNLGLFMQMPNAKVLG